MADGLKMEALLLVLSACLTLSASHLHGSPNHPDDGLYENGEHDTDYDKKMFLGGEVRERSISSILEADDFAELSPEEQQKRLISIIRKIDIDANGYLTVDELSFWIQKSFKHYILEDTKEQFAEVDLDKDGTVTWEEYNIHMYDRIIDYSEDTILEDDEEESFRLIHMKDKKRFERADQDNNSGLNLHEFTDFEHPEETDYMLEFVIEGALEEHDKDGDGFVSLDEYLGEYSQDPATEDPQWLIIERDRFENDYDKDGDGKLDPTELLSWIVPNNVGVSEEEANHLIESIDTDGDGRLSELEIFQNRDIFLTSEATDYGRQLQDEHFYHDEL
ncbi:reticulocalbin-2 isoform X2 [Ranitomeya variabilis]|uniref:reticulocalbin-2 isoform X2 n=1 Tax=Ranitomeya variabilis TaxID=490064 RepID=UPI004055D145